MFLYHFGSISIQFAHIYKLWHFGLWHDLRGHLMTQDLKIRWQWLPLVTSNSLVFNRSSSLIRGQTPRGSRSLRDPYTVTQWSCPTRSRVKLSFIIVLFGFGHLCWGRAGIFIISNGMWVGIGKIVFTFAMRQGRHFLWNFKAAPRCGGRGTTCPSCLGTKDKHFCPNH